MLNTSFIGKVVNTYHAKKKERVENNTIENRQS